mgnify:CR=1 FL=1
MEAYIKCIRKRCKAEESAEEAMLRAANAKLRAERAQPAKVALAVAIFHTQIHRPMYGI